jgi:hypothetical protein
MTSKMLGAVRVVPGPSRHGPRCARSGSAQPGHDQRAVLGPQSAAVPGGALRGTVYDFIRDDPCNGRNGLTGTTLAMDQMMTLERRRRSAGGTRC